MSFHPDCTKPAHEVFFSHKISETCHSAPVNRVPF